MADAVCRRLFNISAARTGALVAGCLFVGGAMELFMVKVWIKDTNCAPAHLHRSPPARAQPRSLAFAHAPRSLTRRVLHCAQSTPSC